MPGEPEVNRGHAPLVREPEVPDGPASPSTNLHSGIGWVTKCIVLGMAVVGLLLLAAYLKFGSLNMAYAYLNGDRLMVSPAELHVSVHADERQDVRFSVRNWSSSPVNIFVGNSTCTCVTSSQLPVKIPAGESAELTISVKFARESSLIQQVTYYTDAPSNPAFTVTVRGHLLDL